MWGNSYHNSQKHISPTRCAVPTTYILSLGSIVTEHTGTKSQASSNHKLRLLSSSSPGGLLKWFSTPPSSHPAIRLRFSISSSYQIRIFHEINQHKPTILKSWKTPMSCVTLHDTNVSNRTTSALARRIRRVAFRGLPPSCMGCIIVPSGNLLHSYGIDGHRNSNELYIVNRQYG